MEEFDEEITPEDITEILRAMLEEGYLTIVGISEDGEPLYKFSQELMDMPEFIEIHESITNDILFSIWNKGFIEMNPVNEEGDWNIDLNEKSMNHELAREELEEDEFILFIQVFNELQAKKGYNQNMSHIKEGDYVMGRTAAGIVHGRVEHIMVEGGTLGTPGDRYALESMPPDNPAMSVRIYDEDNGQWMPTPYSIGMMHNDAERLDTLDGHTMEGEDDDVIDDFDMDNMSKVDIDLRPTDGMKSAARRALQWKSEGKRGGTRVGLARANQIVNGTNLSPSTVARMYSFFSRHEVDKQATGFNSGEEGFPSPGRVAWDLWGGDAGFSWSRKKWQQIQNMRKWDNTPFDLKKFR